MKNIQKIIEARGHKLDGSEPCFHMSIDNPSYMRLVIEGIGLSPDGRQMVSVAHYYEQNGDLMRDPEMVFAIDLEPATLQRPDPAGRLRWIPVSFQQDGGLPIYQEAIVWRDGLIRVRPKLFKDLKSFSRTWNRNIGEQGFVKAAAAKTLEAVS